MQNNKKISTPQNKLRVIYFLLSKILESLSHYIGLKPLGGVCEQIFTNIAQFVTFQQNPYIEIFRRILSGFLFIFSKMVATQNGNCCFLQKIINLHAMYL